MTQVLEVNTATKQATMCARFDWGHTNGPFGPYVAKISLEEIKFVHKFVAGKSESITKYALNLKKMILQTNVTYNYDQDPWSSTENCTKK